MCQAASFKYKCPRCLMRSCSLPCVKQHKLVSGCNGQRDKTAFVSLDDFTDLNLLSGRFGHFPPYPDSSVGYVDNRFNNAAY